MKIIDAHLHICSDSYFNQIARAAGHENTVEHLKSQYRKLGISSGIVMGNRGLKMNCHQYPDFLKYCIGLDRHYLSSHQIMEEIDLLEQHFRRKECVGVKLYPGYNPIYITDKIYEPVYELAKTYHKAVAVHTGETAGSHALLKYSHPLTLDEAAVNHPKVQFIMCHFGNPWLMDAAAVVSKNENVAVDLSGLLEGRIEIKKFMAEKKEYVEALRTWLGYLNEYEGIMFGTDWPLVNLRDYIDFIAMVVPEKYHEKVFFKNAEQIYLL